MKLTLHFSKDATEFINYLSAFKKIDPTLLLEIDIEHSRFGAKSTYGTHAQDSIKNARFEFNKCDITVHGNDPDLNTKHIYLGILNRLGTFISIIREANRRVQKYEDVGFDIIVSYAETQILTVTGERQAIDGCISLQVKTGILPNNKALSMSFGGYSLAKGAISLITDDFYEQSIFYLDETSKFSFEIDQESLESIFRIMEVYKTKGKQDNEIVFNIQKDFISVSNETIVNQEISPAFNEIIYSGNISPDYVGESIRIGKDAFQKSVNIKESLIVYVGMSNDNEIDRLCIETVSPESTVTSQIAFMRILSE